MALPLIVIYALQYLNVPYRWGGQDFSGLDCSGLIVNILRDCDVISKIEDYTAQDIYNKFKNHKLTTPVGGKFIGALAFFGRSTDEITHIGIVFDVNNDIMIHAGSGDRTTTTLERAIEQDARVKFSKVRDDLVAYLYLDI